MVECDTDDFMVDARFMSVQKQAHVRIPVTLKAPLDKTGLLRGELSLYAIGTVSVCIHSTSLAS